jgi:hypothetical protein
MHRDGPDRTFDHVGVDLDAAVFEEGGSAWQRNEI